MTYFKSPISACVCVSNQSLDASAPALVYAMVLTFIFFFSFSLPYGKQGGHIKIHSNVDMTVQVDGEPWLQPPGEVVVFNSALKVCEHPQNNIILDNSMNLEI